MTSSSSSQSAISLPAGALIVGFARTGVATARALVANNVATLAIDDAPNERARRSAAELRIELRETPRAAELARLVARFELVVVSPGVPPSHPIFECADPAQICSEMELASRLVRVPLVAITGTNGKTTVTSTVAEMLTRSGLRCKALGNIGEPLIAAFGQELDVAVVEASSFQLAYTSTFRPAVGTWLNIAADHLDWHRDFVDYLDAKERLWSNQRPTEIAVANHDDPLVLAAAHRNRGRVVTFGAERGDYHRTAGQLSGPGGEALFEVAELPRALPHDVANALAALASALHAGATLEGCRAALAVCRPLPHRVEFVAQIDGVDYYDDSKATTPSAVGAALVAFPTPVLIAGGRNKGLDLGELRVLLERSQRTRLRAVIAIGEATDEIEATFAPSYPVVRAQSMEEAVRLAHQLALPGDAVLLSPGCASFDWYGSYAERGEDFTRLVGELARRSAPVASKAVGR